MIFVIKKGSLDDGPGIRTAVFFKGCPLSCVWCHNPEGIAMTAEMGWDRKICLGCGECATSCPLKAIPAEGPILLDRKVCNACGKCADLCPSTAISVIGKEADAGEIWSTIEKDIPFMRNSGGGVTLTGGEPTSQMRLCSELLEICRSNGVHTLLETCGHFETIPFMKTIYPKLDMVYADIKLIDTALHEKYCGVDNRRILSNVRLLGELASAGGVPVLPRVPLIPSITDTEANLSGVAEFLRGALFKKVSLLPYNPTWYPKAGMVGRTVGVSENGLMSAAELKRCAAFFEGMEVEGSNT